MTKRSAHAHSHSDRSDDIASKNKPEESIDPNWDREGDRGPASPAPADQVALAGSHDKVGNDLAGRMRVLVELMQHQCSHGGPITSTMIEEARAIANGL